MMKVKTLLKEIAFEKNCSLEKARLIYKKYRAENRLKELEFRLKYHKEV